MDHNPLKHLSQMCNVQIADVGTKQTNKQTNKQTTQSRHAKCHDTHNSGLCDNVKIDVFSMNLNTVYITKARNSEKYFEIFRLCKLAFMKPRVWDITHYLETFHFLETYICDNYFRGDKAVKANTC